jgi:very-short-patch-repair endonuclease
MHLGGVVPHGRHTLVVASGATTPERGLWAAVTEVGEPCAVSASAALWLYDVPAAAVPECPEVLVARHRRPRRVAGARVQRVVPRELARARSVRGLPVASVPVAVRRAAAELQPATLADVVEHVLRMRLSTREQLRRALGHGLVGAGRLRAALEVTSPESHSRWERRLAALIRDAGLPRPRRQARVGDAPGYWVDFLFDPWGIGVEVDGFALHAQPETFAYGLRRTRRLRVRHGIEVLAYAPVEIRDHGAEVVAEIAALLKARGGIT